MGRPCLCLPSGCAGCVTLSNFILLLWALIFSPATWFFQDIGPWMVPSKLSWLALVFYDFKSWFGPIKAIKRGWRKLKFLFCIIFRICSGDRGSGGSQVKQRIMEGERIGGEKWKWKPHMGTWVDLGCDKAPRRHEHEEAGAAIEVRGSDLCCHPRLPCFWASAKKISGWGWIKQSCSLKICYVFLVYGTRF